jgi:hypothetical protein
VAGEGCATVWGQAEVEGDLLEFEELAGERIGGCCLNEQRADEKKSQA